MFDGDAFGPSRGARGEQNVNQVAALNRHAGIDGIFVESWEVVEPVDQELAAHQVTGFNLYNDPEGKSAVIHTPEFELTVTYGKLIIQYQEA